MRRGLRTAVLLTVSGVLVGAGGAAGFATLEGLQDDDQGIWTLGILALFAGGALVAAGIGVLVISVASALATTIRRRTTGDIRTETREDSSPPDHS